MDPTGKSVCFQERHREEVEWWGKFLKQPKLICPSSHVILYSWHLPFLIQDWSILVQTLASQWGPPAWAHSGHSGLNLSYDFRAQLLQEVTNVTIALQTHQAHSHIRAFIFVLPSSDTFVPTLHRACSLTAAFKSLFRCPFLKRPPVATLFSAIHSSIPFPLFTFILLTLPLSHIHSLLSFHSLYIKSMMSETFIIFNNYISCLA